MRFPYSLRKRANSRFAQKLILLDQGVLAVQAVQLRPFHPAAPGDRVPQPRQGCQSYRSPPSPLSALEDQQYPPVQKRQLDLVVQVVLIHPSRLSFPADRLALEGLRPPVDLEVQVALVIQLRLAAPMVLGGLENR
jgi:hypothetical protein